MMIKLLCLSLLSLIAPSSAFNPGVTGSLAFSTVEEAKDTYMATILKVVNKIKLPEIKIPNGSLQKNSFQVMDTPNDDFIKPVGNNSLYIAVNGLSAEFMCDQLHYSLGFMSADGSAKATIANMSVSLYVQVVEEKLENGKFVPGINIFNSSVVLPPDSMNLTLQGGFIVSLADVLLPLFKSTIND